MAGAGNEKTGHNPSAYHAENATRSALHFTLEDWHIIQHHLDVPSSSGAAIRNPTKNCNYYATATHRWRNSNLNDDTQNVYDAMNDKNDNENAPVRVDSRRIVVPNAYHGNRHRSPKDDRDHVVLSALRTRDSSTS
jgi:hypothetical protein